MRSVYGLGKAGMEFVSEILVDMTFRQLGTWIWHSEEGSGIVDRGWGFHYL